MLYELPSFEEQHNTFLHLGLLETHEREEIEREKIIYLKTNLDDLHDIATQERVVDFMVSNGNLGSNLEVGHGLET
jgi:hypothetical protein